MAFTSDELNAFHSFAAARLSDSGVKSLQELVDLWDIEHPSHEAHRANEAAVRAAIRDMENGEAGRPAGVLLEELRADLASRRNP